MNAFSIRGKQHNSHQVRGLWKGKAEMLMQILGDAGKNKNKCGMSKHFLLSNQEFV